MSKKVAPDEIESIALEHTISGYKISVKYNENATTEHRAGIIDRTLAAISGLDGLHTKSHRWPQNKCLDVYPILGERTPQEEGNVEELARNIVQRLVDADLLSSTKAQEIYKSLKLKPARIADDLEGEITKNVRQ